MVPAESRTVPIGLGALSALVLAYGVVIAQQVLLAALLVVFVWLGYLAWRVVRALERIAATYESQAGAPGEKRDGRDEH